MFNIAFYLEKYSSIGLKEKNIKNFLIEAIREGSGVEITSEKIKITPNLISLNISGAGKAEVFMNKEKINKIFFDKATNSGYKIIDKKII